MLLEKIELVITREGSWMLISPRDQKRLLLLEKSYPKFLGTERFRKGPPVKSPRKRTGHNTGLSTYSESASEPESDRDEYNSGAAHIL